VTASSGTREYRHCRYCAEWFHTDENDPGACSYHPKLPVNIGNTGPRNDYADIYTFPCCGESLISEYIDSRDVPPSQFPGCAVGRHVVESGWRLFLSYAREDEGVARHMEHELRRRGHWVWRDRSQIAPGASWQQAIDDAIAANDLMVVLVSAASSASAQVRREIDLAVSRAKYLLPVLLDHADIPEPLRAINCIDWRDRGYSQQGFMGPLFDQFRHGVVFGAPDGYWDAIEHTEQPKARRRPAGTESPPQTVVLVEFGDQVGVVRSAQRRRWEPGHLLTKDGIVYVVVDVLERSPTSVQVAVKRAMLPPGAPTAG
jgi:TIR domain